MKPQSTRCNQGCVFAVTQGRAAAAMAGLYGELAVRNEPVDDIIMQSDVNYVVSLL
jgi:hypothetical protein